ncbi:unnamed protein product, partial [Musa banksii]
KKWQTQHSRTRQKRVTVEARPYPAIPRSPTQPPDRHAARGSPYPAAARPPTRPQR